MKRILPFFVFFISLANYGQEYYYINVESGLNVRSEANLSSKKIAKIKDGALVEKIADTDTALTITDNSKEITGKFVKIKYITTNLANDTIEGYVFDAY
ncbi:SH3 domain-containing protein [Aequorivita sp. Q41]|uniref:SH3 domain-containing protein n=1 Tax=Aequorivita sp. Q41 TaxID=3153300 RepID=UPI00324300CE